MIPRGQNTSTLASVIIARKENKGDFFSLFTLVFGGFERKLLRKMFYFDGKEWPRKPGKLLNVIGHIRKKKKVFNFDIQGAALFKRRAFLLTRRKFCFWAIKVNKDIRMRLPQLKQQRPLGLKNL